ncbi:MAG: metallophosphoesterase family protein [Chloroflexota bacterium]|nr:metallophosphoesterase family protein [Chloroflexota bacterium]
MRLGLISDTHISQEGETLPPQIREVFAGVDLILHGGDIYLLSVLDEMEALAPVMAVRGNGDIWLPPDPRLRDNIVLILEGIRLGLTHGLDYPEPSWRTLEAAMQYEFGGKVDILVFGDSHVALMEIYKGVLLINPGSPTFPRQIKELGSVALLEINSTGEAKAQIISLTTKLTSQTITYRPHHS